MRERLDLLSAALHLPPPFRRQLREELGLDGPVKLIHVELLKQGFYQLLTYTDDIDLGAKLSQWEHFYNRSRPHGAFDGKAPYEVLRERL